MSNRTVLFSRQALAVGLLGLGVSSVGFLAQRQNFMVAYLGAYMFWLAIALGSLGYVLIHSLVYGKWLIPFRPFLDSCARTLPWMALLFLPIGLNLSEIYPWADPSIVAQDKLLQLKTAYLNVPFFWIRAAVYFAIWIGLAFIPNKGKRTGAVGLILLILSVSFAAFDWLMSLEPQWFSSIFGAIVIAGCSLSAMSFLVFSVWLFRDVSELASVPDHIHDVGKFMLMSTMLWAYLSFSQYLIIWAGNMAEEVPWYLHRMQGGWKGFGGILILCHFAIPFLLLLSRDLKRDVSKLVLIACFILFMRFMEIRWLVGPAFVDTFYKIHWLDLTTWIGIGGLWFFLFGRGLATVK